MELRRSFLYHCGDRVAWGEERDMPSRSKAQQRFMGAELARKRAGKDTQTEMSEAQLEDFAATKTAKLPEHVKKKKKK